MGDCTDYEGVFGKLFVETLGVGAVEVEVQGVGGDC
jgi:hypothetical protein